MNGFYRFILKLYNGIYPNKFYGNTKLPEGGAIILCNHFRALDPAVIAELHPTDIFFLAKNELFKNKLFSKVLYSLGAFPVDRDGGDVASLIKSVRIVKNGHKLVIFPEGTRNKTGTTNLQPLKGGSGLIAVKTKAPIIPIMMINKSKIFHKNYVYVGDPFYLTDYYDKKLSSADISEMEEKIKEQMLLSYSKLLDLVPTKVKNKVLKKNDSKKMQ